MRIQELPIGALLRETVSGVDFRVAAHHHPGYSGTTLITDHVVAQGCMDAPEPENPDERVRITGNNRYALSNLHQWLNAEGEDWYRPTHPYDTPPTEEILSLRPTFFGTSGHNPYAEKPGFLSWFGEAFRSALLESRIPCLSADQSEIEWIPGKAFIPSAAEIGVKLYREAEGSKLPLFRDFRMRYAAPSPDCIMESEWQPAYFKPSQLIFYWMRTPKGDDTGFSYYCHDVEPYSYKFACMPWMGIRPCMNVDDALEVRPSVNIPGLYLI